MPRPLEHSSHEEELPSTGSEAAAGVEEEQLFAMDRMEQALRSVQDARQKDRLPARASKFSISRAAKREVDPLANAFADMTQTNRSPDVTPEGEAPALRRKPRLFTAAKLGVPAPVPPGVAGQDLRSPPVRYLHIPKDAMKDFRAFAQSAATEALVENNPYVRALNSHRAKLQPHLYDTPRTAPTPMQLMATDPASLAHLDSMDGLPFSVDGEGYGMSPQLSSSLSAPFSVCYGTGCTTSYGCQDYVCANERQEPPREAPRLQVQQLPALAGLAPPPCEDGFERMEPVTPVGNRSRASTACSSPSICDEAEFGDAGPRDLERHSRRRTAVAGRPLGPTLLSHQRPSKA